MNNIISINRNNWFYELIGFKEKVWDFSLESIPDKIKNKMGNFKLLSLSELEQEIDLSKYETNDIQLNVITRNEFYKEEKFDTSSIQCKSKNNSIYQVASNFNCLEVSSEFDNPFDGNYLSFLMSDETQGPSAAGGCVFGSILILSKHNQNRISLLKDIGLNDKNGKLNEKKMSKKDIDELDKNYKKIKIGYLENTTAVIDRNQTLNNKIKVDLEGPKINQVYTSTCIVRQQSKKSLLIQQYFLRVSYESIYLLAIKNQSPELVLTFIGGGVFNNDINTIIRIICKTHIKYSKYLKKDCVVKLPVYMPRYDDNLVNEFKKYMNVNHIEEI